MNRTEYTAARRAYRDACARHRDAVAACEFADYRANALRMVGETPKSHIPLPPFSAIGALLALQAVRRANVLHRIKARGWRVRSAEIDVERARTESRLAYALGELAYARRRIVIERIEVAA